MQISAPGFLLIRRHGIGCISSLFVQIFLRGGEHQLDAVELIDFACAGIVVDGYNIRAGEAFAQFLDHAFSNNMIWQAAKGLGADNVIYSAVDQFHHFAGEKPPFSGLVADVDDGFGVVHQRADAHGRGEMPALCKFLCSLRTQLLKGFDAQIGEQGRLFRGAQIIRLVNLVVEAVKHKV